MLMATLLEQVTQDIAGAMKNKDQVRLAALRMLKAALMNREVEQGRALNDAESRLVVNSLVKQRRDSIEQFRTGGRQDLVEREQAEIVVLEGYLPPAADETAIQQAIEAAVLETGATGPRDMGKVMKATLSQLSGVTVDGRVVSDLVKRRLGGER
jgi:uncharacterized protein YqeY